MRVTCLGLLAVAGTVLVSAADQATRPVRPNVLWLVSEDNAPWLGSYGEPLARTPVLDRLAREGVRFTRAHSAAPVCAATRASLIAGRYAPGVGTQQMRSLVPLPEGLRYYPSYLREAGYFCTNNSKTDYNAVVLPGTWDENSRTAHWKHRRPGQPFFAIFNFTVTHESSLHNRLPLVTDPARVRVPAYLPDTPETRADIAQYHDRIALLDGEIGRALAELEAAGLADDTIVFYYSDHGGALPRSKRFLYANGTHIPLIVRFPAKWQHLAPAAPAAPGATVDELVSMIDFAPTLLSLAGLPVPEQFEGRALAGAARQPGPALIFAFRDRMDECYDLGRAVISPRYRYIRNYRPELPAGQHLAYLWRMASMAEWEKLWQAGGLDERQSAFFRPRAPEELYDVEADPDNMRNLAGDPAHAEILGEMRAANRSHLLATRDQGFMPEATLRRLAGDGSPALVCRDDAVYPLAEVLDTIDRLQLPEPPEPAELAAALGHPNAVIRYWGALAALRSGASPDELAARLSDSDASVRLAAAAAILRRRDDPAAWQVLADALRPECSDEEKLAAQNFLTLLPELPASIRARLEAMPPTGEDLFSRYNREMADSLLARAKFRP